MYGMLLNKIRYHLINVMRYNSFTKNASAEYLRFFRMQQSCETLKILKNIFSNSIFRLSTID